MTTVYRSEDLAPCAVVLRDGQDLTADEARFICRAFGIDEGATFNGAFADLAHQDIEDADSFTASVGPSGVLLWMDRSDDCRMRLPIASLRAHAETDGWVAIRAGATPRSPHWNVGNTHAQIGDEPATAAEIARLEG